jgi:predicted Zn-dependent protease with MMP-like domain
VIALCLRGTKLVDTSGACDESSGFTAGGSSLIDMGNQFANSQSIGNSGRSKEHGGTLAPRREDLSPTATLCAPDRSRKKTVWGGHPCPPPLISISTMVKLPMVLATNQESFEQIVEWAYSTLPQEVRDLPDFPGIQVLDEPPADVLKDISNRKKWHTGTELLGLYSGTVRTKESFTQVKFAPDLIFVFRGPILRCSKGDLRAEVRRVVWHEVAHWLGYETEEQVRALGL